ncbi:pyridoxamine 5'-phosphate oxidase [Aristophania vespae]|uniref:Pyridoxine/pyridoxamine 5'-phosphate oxidase n=1 Tax=Aristophania vespae TaxID=2697033 RepID=A0A6P1NAF1_9PROT|nr:pyridoxamine 5'-phosphate oxidase [Aristophania vespae]QHI95635.1 pyridoxamine 5'-phosphate oxidase [Aristophania vespae]UMM63311.1 Pyridoxine/pyridoxamine 5'-phosphate oxidase [Aristophania vespae]
MSHSQFSPLPQNLLLDLKADPFVLFASWMKEAEEKEPSDPNAMAVATATKEGKPSVRILLLKDFSKKGFVFYTNKNSRKGGELEQNPHAALLFHWKSLRRQIRIEGKIEPVTKEEADAYFASRSYLSRLGAIASNQSHKLQERHIFEKRLEDLQNKYAKNDVIPRPENWSGYRVIPESFEFWQEQPYRLHDRATWVAEKDPGSEEIRWNTTRLYP